MLPTETDRLLGRWMRAQDILTWLNGRSCAITVIHNGVPHTVWTPEDAVSIEDSVMQFCGENNIDISKEVQE